MNKWCSVFAGITLAFLACNNVKQKTVVISKHEDFDAFFKKFETDSITQLSRIDFPLKNVLKSPDGEAPDSIKVITTAGWKYSNFKKIPYLVTTKTILNTTQVEVVFQIEDTGVETQYFFVNKDGKWRLHSITDESD